MEKAQIRKEKDEEMKKQMENGVKNHATGNDGWFQDEW